MLSLELYPKDALKSLIKVQIDYIDEISNKIIQIFKSNLFSEQDVLEELSKIKFN